MGGLPPGGADASVWQDRRVNNDQSAKSYWKNGFVTMYPSLRGSAGNPGFQEGFYGEVDDILAAYEHLAADERVDPKRIYLGGHSTGATLALLVAAATDKFSGVIAFGPVSNPADYGEATQLHDSSNPKEAALRAPINFINQIRIPTIVAEGEEEGNQFSLLEMSSINDNSYVNFVVIKGADHFNHLAKSNDMIASAIANGEAISSLNKERIQSAFDK
jgi:alpha/beta superfamily hydrolase